MCHWEGDIITNAGIDAVILKNKLDLTVDWYKKKVSGLLFTRGGIGTSVVYSGDGSQPYVNLGDMQNTGIDANATYHATIGKDLKLDITGIFTTYKNRIIDLPGLAYRDGDVIRNNRLQRLAEGHPFGAFFGYKV